MREVMKAGRDEQMQCAEWQPLLVLFAAGDELEPTRHAGVAQHLSHCASCSATLSREKDLLALLADHRAEPDAALLASCRANLEDALDREEERAWWRRSIATWLPSSWLSPGPAWSAALLLMIGFSVGLFGPRLLRRASAPLAPSLPGLADSAPLVNEPDTFVPSSSTLNSFDLHTADVAGINVFPSIGDEPPQVELQMKTQQPLTVQGTVDNGDVKRVLLYVLQNNERFGPDVRLNAVDLLRARNNDPEVLAALREAVRSDRNAAVRLKALDALSGADPRVIRETLLDALVNDENPGVRVESMNALRQMAAKGQVSSDDRMLTVLRDRMENDPNTYIRLQSAAAIRDLGPRR